MSLTRETTILVPGWEIGDIKVANYDIIYTAGHLIEPETGWFMLNGASIATATYPILFARFGYTFGGSGASFTLPDYTEGKFPIAAGLTNFPTFGATGGESTHTLGSTELPVHSHSDTKTFTGNAHGHSGSMSAVNGGNHTHSYNYYAGAYSSDGGGDSLGKVAGAVWSGAGGASHGHTINSLSYGSATETYSKSGGVSASSGGSAHNNMMPYIVIGGLLVRHD